MPKSFWDSACEIEHVFICDMTADEAYDLIGSEDSTEALDDALDKARGEVVQRNTDAAFVVIRIR